MKKLIGVFLFLILSLLALSAPAENINVGSKAFTESYVLAEIMAQIIESSGESNANRKFGLGGTGILFEALVKGNIDLYPEYTGTISETILKDPKKQTVESIRDALKPMGLTVSDSLGFNNTYALTIPKTLSEKLQIKKISDLNKFPDLRVGFSHEFMKRPDGYAALAKAYSLNLSNVKALEHSLAYQAISKNQIDLTDAYSTDSKIAKMDLVVLKDDKDFFPKYLAVMLARIPFVTQHPKAWTSLSRLENDIDESEMRILNGESDLDKKSFSEIAHSFLNSKKSIKEESTLHKIWGYTKQHLFLVGISLMFSILVGLPLGIFSARHRSLGQIILVISSLVQTIPSLALLCFLIPLFGIGTFSSLVALFLYGLLPIVVSTYTSLTNLDGRLLESAAALGLSSFQKLLLVELPLASPSILAGIKTSAIINIGTATLAALIGAGGYGAPILTGLALNDIHIILQGAIPAALMALVAHGLFEIAAKVVVPRGLRQTSRLES